MFSYIALAWDPKAEEASAAARRFEDDLKRNPRWRVALQRQGLVVLSAGERQNVNHSSILSGGQGVILGKLFGRDEPPLSINHFADNPGESDCIVRSEGRQLIERYWGRYVAFIEAKGDGFSVLRDPSGALPCFRLRHDGLDIVFSWLEDVLGGMPSLTLPSVSWECLAVHIALGELTGHPTSLDGVTQVLPGELAPLGAARGTARQVWNPIEYAQADPIEEVALASDALHRLVAQCAVSWASCYESIVLRLSGGVDSSILACCLSDKHTPTRVICLNYHSPGSDSDERGYARLAAARAGRELVELQRDAGYRLEQVLDVARTPNPMSYIGRFGARTDAELAASVGAPALFTGAGGDQLFYEFGQWWPAVSDRRNPAISESA